MKISMHASQPFVAHIPSLPESVAMVLTPTIVPVESETTPEPVLDQMSQGAGTKEKEWILQSALAVSLSPFDLPGSCYKDFQLTASGGFMDFRKTRTRKQRTQMNDMSTTKYP